MPSVEIVCAVCETAKRVYVKPSAKYPPKFCSTLCRDAAAPVGTMNRKYTWAAEIDAAVRRVWSEARWGQRRAVAAADPRLREIPYGTLKWRAMRLGLRQSRAYVERQWSRRELAIVEAVAGEVAVEAIQRRLAAAGHHRTLSAIVNKLNKAYHRSSVGTALTVNDVARILGWEHHVVVGWITRGELAADRSSGGGRWRVTRAELVRFIRAHAADRLSRRPLNLAAVIELLDDTRALGRPRTQSA